MNKTKLLNEMYKYFNFALLAWEDNSKDHVQDFECNKSYFLSDQNKQDMCKDMNEYRKTSKCIYKGNKETSTNYNVYERPQENEVILAFRGSDSMIDWQADFSFFKKDFKTTNIESYMTSQEDFEIECGLEFMRSNESFFNTQFNFFKNAKLSSLPFNISISKEIGFDHKTMVDSDNKIESIVDFYREYKNMIKFHGGFLTKYLSMAKEFNEDINKYMQKYKKITIVGHSLGAALAKLAYIFTCINHPNNINRFKCWIYGSPKVGNIFLEKLVRESKMNKKIFICNIETDLVSMVPPNNLGFCENKNDITIKRIKAPYNTKMDHTLFYYLYCMRYKAPMEITMDKNNE